MVQARTCRWPRSGSCPTHVTDSDVRRLLLLRGFKIPPVGVERYRNNQLNAALGPTASLSTRLRFRSTLDRCHRDSDVSIMMTIDMKR